MIHAAINKRKVFPMDDSVRKVVYLVIKDATKKWRMPIQNWRQAMSRFIIECDYNRWRRHSACGGLSPEQFENQNLA